MRRRCASAARGSARARALAAVYAGAALAMLAPIAVVLAAGIGAVRPAGYAYLALLLLFYPPTMLGLAFGSWFAAIAWRCASCHGSGSGSGSDAGDAGGDGDDGKNGDGNEADRIGVAVRELRVAEWLSTIVGVLLVALVLSAHAGIGGPPTFAGTLASFVAAFALVALGSRMAR